MCTINKFQNYAECINKKEIKSNPLKKPVRVLDGRSIVLLFLLFFGAGFLLLSDYKQRYRKSYGKDGNN